MEALEYRVVGNGKIPLIIETGIGFIAKNSDHSIHVDRPDIVIQALKRFIS